MEQERKSEKWIYALGGVFAFTLFSQGGYFALGFIPAGFIMAILLIFKRITLHRRQLIWLLFCGWYMLCSLKNGFVTEYFAKALLPVAVTAFGLLISSETEETRDRLIEIIVKISIAAAAVAVYICIETSVKNRDLYRLLYPFQYSNASGVFFAVTAILAKKSNSLFIKRTKWILYVALILSQSVASIALAVTAELLIGKSLKKTLAVAAGVVIFVILLHSRVYQSMGTFIERILQIRDGMECILKNPIFGIGAGAWEYEKYKYQSGFYIATVIHSSIVQIGVNGGVLCLLLFCGYAGKKLLQLFKYDKIYFYGAAVLILHSAVDFTLSFLAVDVLLLLLLSMGKEEKGLPLKNRYKIIPAVIVVFVFSCGIYNHNKIINIKRIKAGEVYAKTFENSILPKFSADANIKYIDSLYKIGRVEEAEKLADETPFHATQLMIDKMKFCPTKDIMCEVMKENPYNINLHNSIKTGKGYPYKEVEDITAEAIENMSLFGKILYNFQGGEIK